MSGIGELRFNPRYGIYPQDGYPAEPFTHNRKEADTGKFGVLSQNDQ